MSAIGFVSRHSRILNALMMRELTTRFGRQGIGFAWIIGEPLLFCLGVLVLWSFIRPAYEHGVRLGPFVMTGYMCLLLYRHQISFSMNALQANVGLLHHRQVSVLHLYLTRNLLEFAGATVAFIIVYLLLFVLGQVGLPHDWLLLYSGWLLTGFIGMGLGLVLSGLALKLEFMERLVSVITYAMIPASGAFVMTDWIPASYRDAYMLIPMPHGVEMIRAAVFGEFVATHYDVWYALAWGGILNFLGIALIASGRNRIEAE